MNNETEDAVRLEVKLFSGYYFDKISSASVSNVRRDSHSNHIWFVFAQVSPADRNLSSLSTGIVVTHSSVCPALGEQRLRGLRIVHGQEHAKSDRTPAGRRQGLRGVQTGPERVQTVPRGRGAKPVGRRVDRHADGRLDNQRFQRYAGVVVTRPSGH